MKHAAIRTGAALVLLGLLVVVPRSLLAADWVTFNSAGAAPTPFQLKRAKAKGIELKPKPGTPLRGLLFRPKGKGPFPAVALLHDCRGIRPYQETWARELAGWGYVALLVDSFGPRNLEDICARLSELHYSEVVGGRLADAFGARAYLETLPFTDQRRIAVFGWANIVLRAVFNDTPSQGYKGQFRAAVAFNPYCPLSRGDDFAAPVLILIGGGDDSIKPEHCQRMKVAGASRPIDVEVVLYPGALRGFDDPDVGERLYLEDAYNPNKNPSVGITLGYNRTAHEDARKRVKAFLASHLK